MNEEKQARGGASLCLRWCVQGNECVQVMDVEKRARGNITLWVWVWYFDAYVCKGSRGQTALSVLAHAGVGVHVEWAIWMQAHERESYGPLCFSAWGMLYTVYCVLYRVGQNHTCIGIYGIHTVFLAGKSPYIRSYTVQMYGTGQPYVYSRPSCASTDDCWTWVWCMLEHMHAHKLNLIYKGLQLNVAAQPTKGPQQKKIDGCLHWQACDNKSLMSPLAMFSNTWLNCMGTGVVPAWANACTDVRGDTIVPVSGVDACSHICTQWRSVE